eukprot:SAG11_NODE_2967_length_2805_cov_1.906135_1_plen_68_part_10
MACCITDEALKEWKCNSARDLCELLENKDRLLRARRQSDGREATRRDASSRGAAETSLIHLYRNSLAE